MKNLAVFASGNGGNFEAIARAIEKGELMANLPVLICDKKNAFCIERAKSLNIDCKVFSVKDYPSKEDYERAIFDVLQEKKVDFIALCGYMKIISDPILSRYRNKIVNIHPSLLPSFKGAHGIRDAYDYGVKVFGVTIHYVSEELDGGKIVAQDCFIYKEGQTLNEVEDKIHEIEHRLYVQTLKKLLEEQE